MEHEQFEVKIVQLPDSAAQLLWESLAQLGLRVNHAKVRELATHVIANALEGGLVLMLRDHADEGAAPEAIPVTLNATQGVVGLACYDKLAIEDPACITDVYVEYYQGQLVARTWNYESMTEGGDPSTTDVLLTRAQAVSWLQELEAPHE